MRKNKGFTLIELLAVIVILAVIALIATPIIMNVINEAKGGAANDSMYGYVKSVELSGARNITTSNNALTGIYTTKDGDLYQGENKILDVDFKGTKPKDGGTVAIENGLVVDAELTFDGIDVEYESPGTGGGASDQKYTVGEEVYFDPTGTIPDCNASKVWTSSNTGTTCYKWNVIKDNGKNIEILLDHNTTKDVYWNDLEGEYLRAYNHLKRDTESWSKVETLTSADNVNVSNTYIPYTLNYEGMKARFISGQEVANISKNTTWTSNQDTLQIPLEASWLYQNLSDSRQGEQSSAYWTHTNYNSSIDYQFVVDSTGEMYSDLAFSQLSTGVRPVARVRKSNI